MQPQIAIIGAGMHARVVVDLLIDNGFKNIVMVDQSNEKKVYRDIDIFPEDDFALSDTLFVVAIGDNDKRAELVTKSINRGGKLSPAIIHPSVIKSPTASIGFGSVILPGCIIGAGSQIGINSIINSNTVIEHDCTIGDFSHVSSGVVLGGNVKVGDFALIGLGATVIPGINIGDKTTVGAASNVVKNVPGYTRVFGNPARVS